MNNDYCETFEDNRWSVVIVADGDAVAGDAMRAAELTRAGSVYRMDWRQAADATSIVRHSALVLEAEQVEPEELYHLLPSIDASARALDIPVILAFGQHQIDPVTKTMLTGGRVQLLCSPSVADRVTALMIAGESIDPVVLLDLTGENEAARLARLNEEVARIAEVLARLTQRDIAPRAVVRTDLADNRLGFEAGPTDTPNVDAAEIRRVIRARRLREQFLGSGLFEDPAWDMLLDLYAAHLEHAQVSVSSLCIAAAVAPTTALRWIGKMTEAGLLRRQPDDFDRRRAFMGLSTHALEGMNRYVAATQRAGLPIV